MPESWDSRLPGDGWELIPERDGRLGNDRAQRNGTSGPGLAPIPKRLTAKRGGHTGGFDRGSWAIPQAHRNPASVHQDALLNPPKPSLAAQSANQRVMTVASSDHTYGSSPDHGLKKNKEDLARAHETAVTQRDMTVGPQNRDEASRRPWVPDTAAPQSASPLGRRTLGETPASKTSATDLEILLPELRRPVTQTTGESNVGSKRPGLACRRCLWRMGSPQWTQPFHGCRNQLLRGEDFSCQVCKERKGRCLQPPAAVESFAWALQRAWESQGADRAAAIFAAWKDYSRELENHEKKEAKERRAAEATATSTPAPSSTPAKRTTKVFQKPTSTPARSFTTARQPVKAAQQPALAVAQRPVAAISQNPTMTAGDTAAMMAVFAEGMRVGLSYNGQRPEGDFGALASQIIKQYEQNRAMPNSNNTNKKRKRNDEEEDDDGI